MSCRFRALIGVAVLAWCLLPGRSLAHDLKARFDVLPDHMIIVYCWYNSINGPSSAGGADVEITRPQREPIKGTSDADGFFTFRYDRGEPMTIVVRHGDHVSRPVTIAPGDLEDVAGSESGSSTKEADESRAQSEPKASATPEKDTFDIASAKARLRTTAQDSGLQLLKDMMLAVALLFAAAAFIISVRSARRIREMQALMEKRYLPPGQ